MQQVDSILKDMLSFVVWPEYETIPALLENLVKFSDTEPSIVSRSRLYVCK